MHPHIPSEHADLHGAAKPRRPTRDLTSTVSNPDVRLANRDDLNAINARRLLPGTVQWPCTPLAEATSDGSRLEGMAYAGLAVSVTDRRRHTIVVGGTGAGKTYNVALPVLAATLRDSNESVVFTSLKGPSGTEEIRALVQALAPDAEVLVWAPGDRTRSIGCNFVTVARQHGLLGTLARFLCSTIARGSQDSAFWEKVASKAIKAALRYEQIDSIAALHKLFSDPHTLEAFARQTGDPDLNYFVKFSESGSNGATSGIDVAARIAPLDDSDDMRAVISGTSELDPGALLESGKRFVLIIEANENALDNALHAVGLFFTLFFACAVKAAEDNGGVLPRAVTLFLDEFGVMPAIPDFHKTANLGRSRGFSIHVFVQSIDQILITYGATAGAVMAALCTKVFLCSGLGTPDREYASRLAGSIAVQEWQECQQVDPHSAEWISTTRSSRVTIRPLITADDLLLRPHPIFGGYAYVFLVDQPPTIVHFTSSFEIPVIADAIERSRATKPPRREIPLPAVPSTGRNVVDMSARTESSRQSSGFTDCTGWTNDQIWGRIEQIKTERLDWNATAGAARGWWSAFETDNWHRLAIVLRFSEELAFRRATVTECFIAYVYSNTSNLQGVLHYLDYSRLKKKDEKAARDAAAAAQRDEATDAETPAPHDNLFAETSPRKRKTSKSPHSALTFVKCTSCQSLGSAAASTCLKCGKPLPKR